MIVVRASYRKAFVAGLASVTLLSFAAGAQTAAVPDPTEIVVTAQKRVQSIQDVGLSVTALGRTQLAAIGRQDVTALAGQVPSLQVDQYSPTITIFNIRGVSQNDFADSQEAPIAFYSDEVYLSSLGAISGQTFDLERVEVLRGPQGTLFGRNATGGLIQIVSAKPTKELDGFVTLTGGSYGQFATEAALSGPLTSWLRARASFESDNHGGYIHNRIGADIGNANFWGARLQLAADIGARGELTLKAQRLRNDHERSGGLYSFVAAKPNAQGLGVALRPDENFYGTGPGADPFGYAEPDNNPFTGSFDRIGFFDRTVSELSARYVQRFGEVTLTSITDYQELHKRYGEDTDVSPNAIFNYDTRQDLDQISEELRLSGAHHGFTWVAGVYGLTIHSHNGYKITSPAGVLPQQNYGGKLTTDSIAVFGQGEYAFTDRLSAIVGARYSDDTKRLEFNHATAGTPDFAFDPTTDPGLARQTFRDWSGKVELDYKPRRHWLFYASVNRGTKSGGFGTQAFTPIDPKSIPFASEVLVNYEGGFKLNLFNRATNLNVSAFHYDYDNYQAFSTVTLSQFVTNHPAKVTGVEFELNTRPVAGLFLQAFGTYLDTRVKGIVLPFGDVTDRVLPQAPSASLGGLARYERSVGPGKLAIETDWKYNSAQFFSTFNAPIDREGPYVAGNARLSYAPDGGHWEAAVFVNNIADRWYRIYNLDLSVALGDANQSYARPRWIGGSITYRVK